MTSRLSGRALAFAILVVAVLLFISAGPASATTWWIRVRADSHEIAFPREVSFILDVEVVDGEAPIQEVRIYYRVAGQEVTSYGYPDFEPGRRIQARFTLPTMGPDYIPPGTEIEYYYVVQDAQGNKVETEHQLFLYKDTRYAWHMTQIGPLELYWHSGSQSALAYIAPELGTALAQIESVFQMEPERPLRGFIYNSQEEAAAAFPPLSATLQGEQLFAGYAFPDKGLFLGVGMAHYLVVHECAHLYMGQFLGFGRSMLPAWVDEGFAVYMQTPLQTYETFASRLQGEELLPLRTMRSLPGQEAQIRLFYAEAPAVVAYLLENHGTEKFRAFLGEFKRSANTEEALQAAYGFGVEELDDLWRRGIEGVPTKSPLDARFWAVVLPSAILILAMLITMTAHAVRYLRRMRQDDEPP